MTWLKRLRKWWFWHGPHGWHPKPRLYGVDSGTPGEDFTTTVRIPLDNLPAATRHTILEANRIGSGFPANAVLDAVFGKPPSGGGEGNAPPQAGTAEGGGE